MEKNAVTFVSFDRGQVQSKEFRKRIKKLSSSLGGHQLVSNTPHTYISGDNIAIEGTLIPLNPP